MYSFNNLKLNNNTSTEIFKHLQIWLNSKWLNIQNIRKQPNELACLKWTLNVWCVQDINQFWTKIFLGRKRAKSKKNPTLKDTDYHPWFVPYKNLLPVHVLATCSSQQVNSLVCNVNMVKHAFQSSCAII